MSACTGCTAEDHMLCCPSTARIVAAEDIDLGSYLTVVMRETWSGPGPSDFQPGDPVVISVAKYGTRVEVSRDQLLGFGIVDPTAEEQADRERQRAEFDARVAVVAARIPTELVLLDTITDPLSRLVLDLHRRTPDRDRWECQGCPGDAEYGLTSWPCDTVEAIASHYGIDLEEFYLFTRPADGSLDAPNPEDQ